MSIKTRARLATEKSRPKGELKKTVSGRQAEPSERDRRRTHQPSTMAGDDEDEGYDRCYVLEESHCGSCLVPVDGFWDISLTSA
jgi:hypothetical protein